MIIELRKTVKVSEKVDTNSIEVNDTGARDIESTNLDIMYKGQLIGYGHLNNRSNMAHITMVEDNQELEDYLVENIESRNLTIH